MNINKMAIAIPLIVLIALFSAFFVSQRSTMQVQNNSKVEESSQDLSEKHQDCLFEEYSDNLRSLSTDDLVSLSEKYQDCLLKENTTHLVLKELIKNSTLKRGIPLNP